MTGTEAPRTLQGAADGALDEAGLRSLASRLEALERSGALELLEQAASAMRALLDALTPGVTARMASLAAEAGELADELLQGARPVLPEALRALGEAAQEARAWDRAPRWAELARMANDPRTRRGLGFMLAVARHLGARLGA